VRRDQRNISTAAARPANRRRSQTGRPSVIEVIAAVGSCQFTYIISLWIVA
jgi:hypothetical protein